MTVNMSLRQVIDGCVELHWSKTVYDRRSKTKTSKGTKGLRAKRSKTKRPKYEIGCCS